MKIVFYQNSVQKDKIVSGTVHIVEVLNTLTKLGHSVIYADGKHHSFMMPSQTKDVTKSPWVKSQWEKVKKFVWNLPFRGEALVVYYLIKEIILFFTAFETSWRTRPDIIYRRHALFNSEYLLSRIFKIPCVIEVNGLIADEYEILEKGDTFSLWLVNTVEKHNFKRADKYVVVTAKLKNTLNNDFHVPVNKIIVIENGANTNLFKPMDVVMVKKELNLDIRSSFLCFVGGLTIYHGVSYFISAMPLILKEYPNAKALIVGESRSQTELVKGELLSLSHQLAVADKVMFTGSIPYEKVPCYINASEICINPSSWSGRNQRVGLSSLKICEYLACGKPVVASRISGFEFIEENDCGYLVNPASPEELAEAVITLLRDPVSKQRMGENGRKYVLENRSWEIIAKKVAEVYENTIHEWEKSKK